MLFRMHERYTATEKELDTVLQMTLEHVQKQIENIYVDFKWHFYYKILKCLQICLKRFELRTYGEGGRRRKKTI